MNYKYKFKLSNLDCANCAKKIENALNKNENINKASVNFANLSLVIETPLKNGVKELVKEIVHSVEPDTLVYSQDENTYKNKLLFDVIRLAVGIICFILSIFIKNSLIHNILIIIAYLVLLERVLKKAITMLIKGFNIDENLLVSISCIGAYFTNNIHEGLMVIILYEIGKILEGLAVNNTRKSIGDLMDIKPEYANLKVNGDLLRTNPTEVKINDIIVIKKGEKVPLDGKVIEGHGLLDKKALTGESILSEVNVGDEILSGSINTDGLITMKVTKLYENSTVAQILSLVENASDKKAKTEKFVSKAARIYTPIILLLAILIALLLPLVPGITFSDSLYRALVFLVVSCPCAIAISVPLAYFSGIGASSNNGILIKGSDYLEGIRTIKEIIFDKTGTITNNENLNYSLEIYNNKYKKEEILKYYVSGEELSNHPIAKSILKLCKVKEKFKVRNFKEIEGNGISFKIDDDKIKIGSAKFCNYENNIPGIFLSINNEIISKLLLIDGIKENAKETIEKLNSMGINVKMFTGDSKSIALDIAKKVGIKDVSYELLPKDKFNLLEKEIKKYNGNVAFVGDGVNDAPALRIAKVGISMGNIGSASAIEASDVVIMNDNLNSLLVLLKISHKTDKIIKQNLIFAFTVKILVLILSAIGIATMWQAVFADTGVTLLTILNTTRILKKSYCENKNS